MASFFGSGAAKREAEAASRAQRGIANRQMDLYDQTLPLYRQALQFWVNRANGQPTVPGVAGTGYGTPAYGAPQMTAPGLNGGQAFAGFGSRKNLQGATQTQASGAPFAGAGTPGVGAGVAGPNNQQLGIWGNPEDSMRFAAAEDDILNQQHSQEQQLKHNLAQRGLADSNLYAAGLAQLAQNALTNMSDFRRQLAIDAGQEGERRQQNLMNALAPGLGMGQMAAQTYGNVGQMANQQQQQAMSQLGGLTGGLGQLAGLFFGAPTGLFGSGPAPRPFQTFANTGGKF